ncbi:DMT family transporter [Marinomonas sp. 15G1-11]|uniref:DMT family transporter n=1 Tax=Marinomonas phaeophyticola TaxID=3004091 RepID=A0ABT4JWN4_9GAMM|nr:DMT family transporter [Marinomonas sp. 15G1-11]MCZ2722749.1 DMT family transporter [Marinomonas sp. 15G1-11]
MQTETKGMLYGLLGVCVFGLTLPVTRIVVPYMDPIFIGMGRAVVAAILAIAMLVVFRQPLPNRKQFIQLIWVALGVVIGFPVFSSWAMQYVPAAHGGVVLGILPLATAIAGAIINHERPSLAFWVVGIVGSMIVVGYSLIQGAGHIHVADFALLAAIICAALGYAVGGKLSKELGGWQVICWALIVALPVAIYPTLSYAPTSFSNIPLSGYVSFFYLSIMSQFLGFFVWYKGLALGGIARVSQVQLLQPFITLIASIAFLREAIDMQTFIFVCLVVVSVWIGKKMPIEHKLK